MRKETSSLATNMDHEGDIHFMHLQYKDTESVGTGLCPNQNPHLSVYSFEQKKGQIKENTQRKSKSNQTIYGFICLHKVKAHIIVENYSKKQNRK